MRLGISTQEGIIERVARQVRARMSMNVDQSRKKPAAVHHRFSARDGLMRHAIAVNP
jgi:C4-type Zn-finger protein